MTTTIEPWMIEFNSGIPVYKQIINQICTALAGGNLKEGDRLPTIRELHEKLNVNPNTVAKAYRELELKGIISSQRGNGSFVASQESIIKLPQKEKEVKMAELYSRMLTEAKGHGIPEEEFIKYIHKRKSHESSI